VLRFKCQVSRAKCGVRGGFHTLALLGVHRIASLMLASRLPWKNTRVCDGLLHEVPGVRFQDQCVVDGKQ
jgi:hypothetical protein